MTEDEKFQILTSKLDGIIGAIHALAEAMTARKADSGKRHPVDIEFTSEVMSALYGSMGFNEICVALGMENNGKNRVAIGEKLKSLPDVTIKRNSAGIQYIFPDQQKRHKSTAIFTSLISRNLPALSGKRGLIDILNIIGEQKNADNMASLAVALRVMRFSQDKKTGLYQLHDQRLPKRGQVVTDDSEKLIKK